MIRLDKGEIGKRYRVVSVKEGDPCLSCTPCLRLRLLEFGLLGGEIVEVIRGGEPMIIKIDGNTQYGIRGDEAVRVEIEEI